MASKNYTTRHRRVRKQKTDYKQRLKLLLSKTPRAVIRCLNNSIVVQIIEYTSTGDKVIASGSSLELKKLGWNYSGGNMPAAYLAGYLAGTKARKKVGKVIIDSGLQVISKQTRLFAAVKGLIDAGLNVPCSKEKLPSEERCLGADIENYAKLLLKEGKYEKQYSLCVKRNVKPEEIVSIAKKIKESIR